MQTIVIIIVIVAVGIVLYWQQERNKKELKSQARKIELINLANEILRDLSDPNFIIIKYYKYNQISNINKGWIDLFASSKKESNHLDLEIDEEYALSITMNHKDNSILVSLRDSKEVILLQKCVYTQKIASISNSEQLKTK